MAAPQVAACKPGQQDWPANHSRRRHLGIAGLQGRLDPVEDFFIDDRGDPDRDPFVPALPGLCPAVPAIEEVGASGGPLSYMERTSLANIADSADEVRL
jgi:hypothetical protein